MSDSPGPASDRADEGSPWVDDARRVLGLLRAALDEAGSPGGPLEQGLALLRRAGPELLDEVADLATGLAGKLRADAARAEGSPNRSPDPSPASPADPSGEGPSPPAGVAPPPTVRIDVTG